MILCCNVTLATELRAEVGVGVGVGLEVEMGYLSVIYKQIIMGAEQSWCEPSRPTSGQTQIALNSLSIDEGKYVPCQPYTPSEQANQSYQKLFNHFSGNKYLNLQLPEGTVGVREQQGYFKLTGLDACYSGEWKDRQPHGRGIAVLSNGCMLIGTFVQGSCIGNQNYFFFKDGSIYQGGMAANRLSGKGKLTTSTMVYEGEWRDNLPQGEGMESYKNGDRYIGSFEKGVKQGEACTFTWGSHETYLEYKGGFWQGHINGEGTLTLRNKTTLRGYFEGNSINNVTLTSPKLKFTGNFEAGKASGKGVLQLIEPSEGFDGQFREGRLCGPCRMRDAKSRETDIFVFEGRQLKRVSGLSNEQTMKIVRAVQGAYGPASKHSEALAEICQDLEEDYECRFVEPFENLFKFSSYAAINVYDRVLLVRAKRP